MPLGLASVRASAAASRFGDVARTRGAKPQASTARLVDLDKLKELPGNPRTGDVSAIAGSLERNGQFRPIVVNTRDMTILAGNHTAKAARQLGWQQIRVWYVDADEATAKRIALADNRTAELGGYDDDNLAAMLKDIGVVEDLGALEGTGWTPEAALPFLDTLMGPDGKEPPKPDDIPKAPAKPKTKRGDIYELGPHRLLCGDSQKAEDVAVLMGEDLADLIFTSPPYNVDVVYAGKSEGREGWELYGAFLRAALEAWLPVMAKGRAVAWNIGASPAIFPHRQVALFEDLGLNYIRQMVWRKMGVPLPKWHFTQRNPRARQFTPNPIHELVYIFGNATKLKLGEKVAPVDDLCEHDVFEIHQSQASAEIPDADDSETGRTGSSQSQQLKTRARKKHPAPFPVRLAEMFVHHLAGPGEIVVDPFAGAGTVMIAAERLGRRARLMEIEPAYCDVTVERWERLTGGTATRIRG